MVELLYFLDKKNISNNKENSQKQDIYNRQSISTSSLSFSSIDTNERLSDLSTNNLGKNRKKSILFHPNSISNNIISKLSKIGKNTRSSYFNKLMSKNLFNLKQKKYNNIFIFDWDDTLLCTSVLSPKGYFDDDIEISEKTLEKIKKLEIYVKTVLSKAIEKGDTYIITNSELEWIDYSCQRFFPSVYELIKKIKIISARDLYEEKYPNDYKLWKIKAFNDIIKNYSLLLPTNIMSFGDSSYEIDAAFDIVTKFNYGFIKAIKFKEYPLISDIISQLMKVLEKFENYYKVCKNCTIFIDE
jgi:hypothetical protein